MAKLIISDKDFLVALDTLTEEAGYPPTIREMVDATPYSSTSSLSYRLRKLEKSGHILQKAFSARTIRLSDFGFALIAIKSTPRPTPQFLGAQPTI